MSDINYNIWGTPETWGVWSDSPTNNTIWGNIRVGASNYTNADFTDYPQFKLGNKITLRDKYNNSEITVNTPLDNSIAYTAIANPELPQCNVGLFGKGHTTKNNPLAFRDSENPLPFALAYFNDLNDIYYNMSSFQQIYGFDGFPDNASIIGQQKFQRWSPYAAMNSVNTTTAFEYNQEGSIMPVLSFGIKSVIFEIVIRYEDNNDETLISNLKSYLNHNDTWLQSHKCVGAYLRPYYRVNTDGTYSYTVPTGVTTKDRANGIQPIFFTPYKMGGIDIYNYSSQWARTAGCLPIYGNCIVESSYIYRGINSYLYDNPDNDTCSYWALIYGYDKGNLHVDESGNSANTYITLDLSVDENVEYIMKGAAAYGLFFCKSIGSLGDSGRDSGVNERWIDSNMYCGVIRADGMTYGEYTQGEGNKDNPVYGWKTSTETPYIPGQSTNIYSQQTRIKSIGRIDTMCDRYVLNSIAVNALAVDLFTIMSDLSDSQTDWTELIEKSIDTFLVQNPIDCIVSLKKYPVKKIPNTGDLTNIHYGRYSTGSAAGYPCTADVYTYAFTPRKIQPRFGNSYLDYEPFTSAEIFIPYCGSINLKMCDILDKQLEPFLCVDYHTGQCTGFVMCDGIVIETIQGTIAIDVPITGIQTATVESQLMQSANASRSVRLSQAFSAIEGLGKITLGAKFGGALGGATGLANAAKTISMQQMQKYQADYDLTHTAAPQHVIGSSSSACGWIIDSDTARLILYYPTGGVINDDNPPNLITAKLEDFGALYGFATIESGTLSSYTGFTAATQMQLDNITTTYGQPATDPEIELIRSAISEGIII